MDAILAWISDNPSYSHYLVFSLACFEAAVGIGLFIPGAVLLSIAVFLYTQQLIRIFRSRLPVQQLATKVAIGLDGGSAQHSTPPLLQDEIDNTLNALKL